MLGTGVILTALVSISDFVQGAGISTADFVTGSVVPSSSVSRAASSFR
jgi:hypothetical protein